MRANDSALIPTFSHLRREKESLEWRILSTPPLSGIDNMALDAETLARVDRGEESSMLRFFRFQEPTLSYGRLQKRAEIAALIPGGWADVQRPTGGGIVFHEEDLCFSLCWKAGLGPLPSRPQEQYRWIHAVVLEGLSQNRALRMAACCDVAKPVEAFSVRTCFQNPVGYDLLENRRKILGGALRCTRHATLYQGSLQMAISPALEARLAAAFKARLTRSA